MHFQTIFAAVASMAVLGSAVALPEKQEAGFGGVEGGNGFGTEGSRQLGGQEASGFGTGKEGGFGSRNGAEGSFGSQGSQADFNHDADSDMQAYINRQHEADAANQAQGSQFGQGAYGNSQFGQGAGFAKGGQEGSGLDASQGAANGGSQFGGGAGGFRLFPPRN